LETNEFDSAFMTMRYARRPSTRVRFWTCMRELPPFSPFQSMENWKYSPIFQGTGASPAGDPPPPGLWAAGSGAEETTALDTSSREAESGDAAGEAARTRIHASGRRIGRQGGKALEGVISY
jgi:hypothetical protein